MLRRFRNICMIVCSVFAIIVSSVLVSAEPEEDEAGSEAITIKVAFCQMDGFFSYNEDKVESGYGVDYLNELKKYIDVNWEYVHIRSWKDAQQALIDKTIDMIIPTDTDEYDTSICTSTEKVITSYHCIMTLKSREEYYFHDYDAIKSMKLAITSRLMGVAGVEDYLEALGVSKNLVYYEDYENCRQALLDGQVDGLICNVFNLTEDMKVLDKFAGVNNFLAMRKDDPSYPVINSALSNLQISNPTFATKLGTQYFHKNTVDPYTREELAYISSHPVIKVATATDRKPISYFDEDTQEFKGIAIDIAENVAKSIGIQFEYIPVTHEKFEDVFLDADLLLGTDTSMKINHFFCSNTFLKSELEFVVKTGKNDIEKGDKIGVLSSAMGMRQTLSSIPYIEIVKYDDNSSALRALQNGNIDAFVNSTYVVNFLLDNPRYSNLGLLHYKNTPLEYAFAGREDDEILKSIINKGIGNLTEDEVNAIILANTRFSIEDISFGDKIYIYRLEILMGAGFLLFIIILMMLYNHSRIRFAKAISERTLAQERANAVKGDFLSQMSHDLRTPMNAIIGLSYLGENTDIVSELHDYHKKINQSGQYLLRLINDTLDISKMDNDKMELHLEPYMIKDLVEAVQVMFLEKKKEKNIDFVIEAGDNVDIPLMLDKLRLEQICVNLINNAFKFTDFSGQIRFIIHVTKATNNKLAQLLFTVKDNGCGMTEDFQKTMYDPFTQGNPARSGNEAGTGLGLSIVKRLTTLMGGDISCQSVLGKGTEFTVRMSAEIYNGVMQIEEPAAKAQDKAEVDEKLYKKRVLLCEDHPMNTQIAVRLFQKKGMFVETAENGKVGVVKFAGSENNYYQLILMDIRMPVMDGLEATRAIRKLDREDAKRIPIIAMTANAYNEDTKKSLDAGMNAHLTKPIEPRAMYETIAKYL